MKHWNRQLLTIVLGTGIALFLFACDLKRKSGIPDPSEGPPGGTRPRIQEPKCENLNFPFRRRTNFETKLSIQDLVKGALIRWQGFPPDAVDDVFFENAGGQSTPVEWVEYLNSELDRVLTPELMADYLIFCTDEAEPCLQEVVKKIGRRAFRRTLYPAEVSRLRDLMSKFIANGKKFEFESTLHYAMYNVIKAILLSPQFIFLNHGEGQMELASRLGVLLRGSVPNQAMLDEAEAGTLSTPNRIRDHVVLEFANGGTRFRIAKRFAGQWLSFDQIRNSLPDQSTDPELTSGVKEMMSRESRMLFEGLFLENRPASELLSSNYSFLNKRLADYYGIPSSDLTDDEFVKVIFSEDSPRSGILTHGSYLVNTSSTAETNVVTRGKWILERVLCTAPPSPDSSLFDEVSRNDFSDLDRLQNPSCSSCHQVMDPVGAGFDVFGPAGKFRETDDEGDPISVSGEAPGVGTFGSHQELISLLAGRTEFQNCVAAHWVQFSTGTEKNTNEQCVADVVSIRAGKNAGLQRLLETYMMSEYFIEGKGAARE